MMARSWRFGKLDLTIECAVLKTFTAHRNFLLLVIPNVGFFLVHLDHLLQFANIVIRPFFHILKSGLFVYVHPMKVIACDFYWW